MENSSPAKAVSISVARDNNSNEVNLDFTQQAKAPNSQKYQIGFILRKHKILLASVIIPTFIAIVYYGFIASNIYISESQFVVRSSKQQQPMGLGLLFGGNISSASGESHSVSAYMLSRDALRELETNLAFKQMNSRDDIDFLSSFDYFNLDNSFEALHRYYQNHVSIYFDPTTSISTLRVRSYNSKDSHSVNAKLLELAELHINQLNERARRDLVRFAQNELDQAEKSASDATQALDSYRINNKIFNPAEFERLSVEKGFTLEQLKIRRAALESAITDAMRQQLYLERVVQPNLPDVAVEPLRLRKIFSTFLIGMVIWGVLSMLYAGVKEHHE
jgi:capsular polysaccharide transport system permease protein